MKKRIFSLILACLMMVSALSTVSFAETDVDLDIQNQYEMKFIVDTVTVDNDDEWVEISIKTERNGGFAGVIYQLVYDSNVFSLEEDPVKSDDFASLEMISGPLGTGKHNVMLTSSDGTNVIGDGTLVTYTFAIDENAAAGTYEFKLITSGVADITGGNKVSIEVLDENGEPVANTAVSGSVTIPGYSVTYDANGGSGAPGGVVKSKNVNVAISSVSPVREGYYFLGWATSKTATTPEYRIGDKYTLNEDVVLYAVWEKKPETAGTVKMEVTTAECRTNGEVTLNIDITENPGIHAMVFDVVYDDTALEYVSTQKGLYGDICVAHANKLSFQYMDLYNYGNTITEIGTLLSITFKVKDDASEGLAAVTVVPDKSQFIKLIGENANEAFLDVEVVSGGVEVATEIPGDINLDESINSEDAVLLLKHLIEGAKIDYKGSLDFDGDDDEDYDDAVALLRFALFGNKFPIEEASLAAEGEEVFTAKEVLGYTGEEVDFVISLNTTDAFKAVGITNLTYPTDVFTLNGCTIADEFGNIMYIKDVTDNTFVAAVENALESYNGKVLTLNFTVKENAEPGMYAVYGDSVVENAGQMHNEVVDGMIEVKHISEKPIIPVEAVVLDSTAYVATGATLKLDVTILPEEASNKTLTWISANEAVATVDGNGVVTAHKAGSAKITATSDNGKKATITVTVGTPADTVAFSSLKATSLAVGKTLTLKAAASRADKQKPASTATTFEILSGEEYISIDAKGKVTALSEGKAVVRAKAVFGTEEAFADVEINVCVLATKVTLNTTKASMALGYGNLELSATTLPAENTDSLKWTVDKPEIATVDENGVVTAHATGKVKVTAMTGSGKSAYCTVTIGEPATAVEVTALKVTSVAVGKSITLKGKATRDDKIKPVSTTVVFEIIEGEEFATIDAKGKLTGVAEGDVVVRIKAEAGTEDAYEDVVIRVCTPATKVTLNLTKASMALGYDDLQLEATMLPVENTDTLTWSVDKPEIATVDENGVVTAHAAGKVKVTALTGSGKKATCTVTIGEAATAVEVTALKVTSVAPGKAITLKGKATRDDKIKPVSTTVVFEIIEGEEFATIDAKGKLTGVAEGDVVVRIKAEAGTEDAYEDVVIRVCTPATKVTLNLTKATVSLSDGELQLVATTLPDGNTDKLTWSVDKPEIATVDEDGLVTLHSAGKVKITALAGSGKSAYCTVTVTE